MSEHTKEAKKLVQELLRYLMVDRNIDLTDTGGRKLEKKIQAIFKKYVPDPQRVRKLEARISTLEQEMLKDIDVQ